MHMAVEVASAALCKQGYHVSTSLLCVAVLHGANTMPVRTYGDGMATALFQGAVWCGKVLALVLQASLLGSVC